MSEFWYITFSGEDYDATTEKIVNCKQLAGVDNILVYDDVWLAGQEFFEINRHLWETAEKVGFGWHAWKPLIILDALNKASPGDVVLYTDADTYPIANLDPIWDEAQEQGAMFFAGSGHRNRQWIKRDCYRAMAQDHPQYHDAQHGCAQFVAIKKGMWKPTQFLMEWLTYSVNPFANTRQGPSVLGEELPGFREHRTEQAIMTLLALRYGYTLHQGSERFFVQQHQTHGNNGKGSRWRNVT